MSRLNALLTTDDLPLAELCAARLDGELFGLDECYLVPDLPCGSAERARALDALAPRIAIAELWSAAWVHGATAGPPEVHTLCVDTTRRRRMHLSPRVSLREVRLSPTETVVIADRPVTTAMRTAIDLARMREPSTPRLRETLAALAVVGGFDLESCRERLRTSTKLPYKRLAAERLTAALSLG